MTKLPDRNLMDGTKSPETTTGEFRLAMGNIRQFLFDLFGDESSDKETARQTLGINLAELNDDLSKKADQQTVDTALSSKADITELSGVAFTGNYNDLIDKLEKSSTLEGYGILVDSTPVAGSTRPVTSSGIKNYVDTKVANAVVPSGIQIFKSSGTFTVPHGVNCVKVRLCGGGGGGGTVSFSNDPKYGGTGGTSSFGSYVSATGGGGGGPDNRWGCGQGVGGDICLYGKNGDNRFSPSADDILGQFGLGGAPHITKYGGNGGYAEKTVTGLVSGMVITVTIGGGGTPANLAGWGSAGICIVEW